MGNTNSAQPPKPPKDRKKETHGSADTGKGRRPANGKKTGQSYCKTQPREFNGHRDPRTTNPFIIFFLRLRSKKPKERVTVIARAAGKLWTRMTPEQRQKYIDLANAEKKRRQDRRRKRKRSSACYK